MSKRVLVVSSANMDITLPVERLPQAGETMLSDGSVTYSPGADSSADRVRVWDPIRLIPLPWIYL